MSTRGVAHFREYLLKVCEYLAVQLEVQAWYCMVKLCVAFIFVGGGGEREKREECDVGGEKTRKGEALQGKGQEKRLLKR